MKEKIKSLLPLLCGYLGYILWGFSYKFITVAQQTTASSVLLSHRFVISCIIMLVLVATRLVKVDFRNKKWGSAVLLVTFQFAYYLFESATAKATIKASGDGLKYTWYVKNAGATKYTKSSVTSATYSCKMSEKTDGRQAYCVIKDTDANSITTATVTFYMQ